MSVRRTIDNFSGIYFITFTCYKWLNLFQIADAYTSVYKWFDYLKEKGHFILAYVIMPNHVHVVIAFRHTQNQAINSIVGNGKRFMAYEIVKRLNSLKQESVLEMLEKSVTIGQKRRGKLHEVFEPSFDWKECTSEKFTIQKLDYIHENPCRGKWNLAANPSEYLYSSAAYYLFNEEGHYPVTHYAQLNLSELQVPLLDSDAHQNQI